MLNGNIIGNRYEIIETIGKGGMAIVYKAKCMMLNRYVALKVLRPEFREDTDFISRFQAEARSAGSLSHPNIVSVYDVGQDGDLDYIVMEYVEGVTLKQYLDAKGVIPWREAVDYAAQICAGLDHAHKNGIVHKDIKPQNIIITREGTLKITDFGIAKVMSSSTIAAGSDNMGSVQYFSPEQARGGFTDGKTDIYSLGIVLYEMATGRLPFQGDTAIAIAMQHIEKEPTSPCDLNPELPEGLGRVILRAMNKEQGLRYETASQMLVDLKKVYIGHNVDTTPAKEDTPEPTGMNQGKNSIPEDLLYGNNKNKKKSKKKDVLGVIAGILTGLALVIVMFLLGYHFVTSDKAEEIELPDLKNMTFEAAEAMIVNSNLELVIEKEVESDTVDAGKIISQSPEAGKMVKEDTKIKVVLSLGEGDFPMPELVNRNRSDVERILKEKDLVYTIVEEASENIPKDYVVRQTPDAGTYIDKATTVTVYVSIGKEDTIVEVPNLLGLSESEAKAKLLDEGLTWGQIKKESSTRAKGTVLSQSIRAGVEVKEKTAIDLKISSGPSETTPPTTTTPNHSQTPGTQTPSDNPTTTSPGVSILPPNASGE